MKQQNEIWGRGWRDWLILFLGVINLLVGLQFIPHWFSGFYFFTAGSCFSVWLFSSIINSYCKITDSLLKRIIKLKKRKMKGGKEKWLDGLDGQR